MPVLLPAIALLLLSQDLKETHGKTNAQILTMGRSRWSDFYTEKEGGASTMSMAGAESLYSGALAARNNGFGKAKIGRLRTLIRATARNACEVGSVVSGGGTMWNIIGTSLMTDGELALYQVLSNTGKPPKHVVSDVEKAYAKLRHDFQTAESSANMKNLGHDSLRDLRKNLDGVIAEAARRPRKSSDALLDFCVKALTAGTN